LKRLTSRKKMRSQDLKHGLSKREKVIGKTVGFPYTLKLDLDDPNSAVSEQVWGIIYHRLTAVEKFFRMKNINTVTKLTKHGSHDIITFTTDKQLTDYDIVFLQLLLLSDWKRELFNWLRVRSGCKKWNVLYKQKFDKNMKLISREI